MNYVRLVLAALAATLIDGLYGWVVWGKVLSAEFGRYPGIFRPAGDMSGFRQLWKQIGEILGLEVKEPEHHRRP